MRMPISHRPSDIRLPLAGVLQRVVGTSDTDIYQPTARISAGSVCVQKLEHGRNEVSATRLVSSSRALNIVRFTRDLGPNYKPGMLQPMGREAKTTEQVKNVYETERK